MRAKGRAQINFELEPVKEIDIMANLPKMIFPWIWFDEGPEIPDTYINLLKYTMTLLVETLLVFHVEYWN